MTSARTPDPVASVAVPEWIDCSGRTLTVRGGRVLCPLQRGTVPVTECLGCRFLSTASGERDPDRDCRLPDPHPETRRA